MRAKDFVVVGPGRVGLRLAAGLVEAGWRCRTMRSARPLQGAPDGASADVVHDTWSDPAPWPHPRLVLVTVPDRALASVAAALAREPLAGTVVLHTSGLETAEVLAPCRAVGATVASWHPLQSFPPLAVGPVRLAGVACAVEGDPAAVTFGEELALSLGLRSWRIQAQDKSRYHAAAAVAANLTHVLINAARRQLEACGLTPEAAAEALAPLLATSTSAALAAHAFEALTGPAARGDTTTVRRHLEVLPAPLAEAYRAVLKVVAEQVAPPDRVDRLYPLC